MSDTGTAGGYRVKEMHLTLQGEGANTGLAVVLLRFEGCNLDCEFCDTDFTGTDGFCGGVYKSESALAEAVLRLWQNKDQDVNVLCTGGEPMLQLDRPLIDEFHRRGFRILVETNGSIPVPGDIDWICVSPKKKQIRQSRGNEIKIVWPQDKVMPEDFNNSSFEHFCIQPMYNGNYSENLRTAIAYCLRNPRWRLSLQTHRYTKIF